MGPRECLFQSCGDACRLIERCPLKYRDCEFGVSRCKVRIELDGAAEKALRRLIIVYLDVSFVPEPALGGFPRAKAFRRFADRAMAFHLRHRGLYRSGNGLRDLVLHGENVGRVAVVSFRPEMVPGRGIDKLAGDADRAAAATTYAALEHIVHAKLARDLMHADGAILVNETGVARDDEEEWAARQHRDDVLGDAVGKIFLLRIPGHVLERQDCN